MTDRPRRTLGALWWAGRRSSFLIFLREISSVFIAAYVVLLIILIAKAGGDQASYESYFALFDFAWNARASHRGVSVFAAAFHHLFQSDSQGDYPCGWAKSPCLPR